MRQAVMRQIYAGNVEVRAAAWCCSELSAERTGKCQCRHAVAARPDQATGVIDHCAHLFLTTQVSIVGDLDPVELEECVLMYLGTVSPEPKVRKGANKHSSASGDAGNQKVSSDARWTFS